MAVSDQTIIQQLWQAYQRGDENACQQILQGLFPADRSRIVQLLETMRLKQREASLEKTIEQLNGPGKIPGTSISYDKKANVIQVSFQSDLVKLLLPLLKGTQTN